MSEHHPGSDQADRLFIHPRFIGGNQLLNVPDPYDLSALSGGLVEFPELTVLLKSLHPVSGFQQAEAVGNVPGIQRVSCITEQLLKSFFGFHALGVALYFGQVPGTRFSHNRYPVRLTDILRMIAGRGVVINFVLDMHRKGIRAAGDHNYLLPLMEPVLVPVGDAPV